ncbi:hypothetical protein [Microbacterium sp.]|uniref:hypothetical protein n=1 Tax=Microbacterium sp. TaxID=51671 RepID=UPI003A945680
MAPEVAEVLETIKSLSRDQLADLAYEVLRVLDDDAAGVDPKTVEATWNAEFRTRVDEFESGGVESVSHDDTVAQARALIAAHRK